ncbi:MAG: helix-turn-helix transcriptional regulator [Burkholderiales bacterium]|nr:helix-turn-helix transcriptional regulator [Burkholderiales bacterium]
MKDSLANRLNYLMIKLTVSNTALARSLDMPIQTIQKIRTGVNENPTLSTLRAIAKYFKITVSQLIGDQPLLGNGVPILSMEQALTWEDFVTNNTGERFLKPINPNKKLFAIVVDSDNYVNFAKEEVLLIDPMQHIFKNCYVLVNKIDHKDPTIKKIIEEDGVFYLKSLIAGMNSVILLDNEYPILGVIVASYKAFIPNSRLSDSQNPVYNDV